MDGNFQQSVSQRPSRRAEQEAVNPKAKGNFCTVFVLVLSISPDLILFHGEKLVIICFLVQILKRGSFRQGGYRLSTH